MTAEETGSTPKERALGELRSDIETTREQLAQTLDAIEDKLNVQKQAQKALHRLQERFNKLRKENPVVIYIGAGAAVAVAGGLVVWRMSRR